VSSGNLWLNCAVYGVFWRIDARRQFSNVVSNGIPRLTYAKRGVETLGVGFSGPFQWHPEARVR
jgi:hypothetical protein